MKITYIEEFNALVDYLLKSSDISDINKVIISRETNEIKEKHFESHLYVSFSILKKLKENDVYYEIEGPLSTSFILYYLNLINDEPIISTIPYSKKISLTISIIIDENHKKTYGYIEEALKEIGQEVYVYKEVLKRYPEIYIPYLYNLVAIFDKNIYKECIELNDSFRVKRIALSKDKVTNLSSEGMLIEIKGKFEKRI